MEADYRCYRCGSSLAALTPPIGRHDECPACGAQIHVCCMCTFFDPGVAKQCREDDAEEVFSKERANFCEWFEPSATAFREGHATREQRAKQQLDALFGGEKSDESSDTPRPSAADDLFK